MLLCKTSKPCHIVWYKESCLIWNSSKNVVTRSGNESRLTIHDVRDSDAGVYECDARSVSTKATVTVKSTEMFLLSFGIYYTLFLEVSA